MKVSGLFTNRRCHEKQLIVDGKVVASMSLLAEAVSPERAKEEFWTQALTKLSPDELVKVVSGTVGSDL